MSKFIVGQNVSHAWYCAASHLLALPDQRTSNLVVAVTNPLAETDRVRPLIDEMFGDQPDGGTSTTERVADTIFPLDLWDADEEDSARLLFERREEAREVGKELVPNGNYFDWFCQYPNASNGFNQLEFVLKRLRAARKRGWSNANRTQVGLPPSWGMRVQTPGKHTNPMGFPCLSHVSVTLAAGRIDVAATYRAQDFVHKGYGNFVGLGRLVEFLSKESGYEAGEVLCVATGAVMIFKGVGKERVYETVNRVGALVPQCGVCE